MKSSSIQYIRGIAACLVVLYHAAVFLGRIRGDTGLHDLLGGRPGLYGVAAFFVLSGLLMAEIAPRYPAFTFLTHRALRIFPAYWVAVVLAHLLFVTLWHATRPDAGHVPNIVAMLHRHGWGCDTLRLVLSPMAFPDYPLGVEWTLLYETTFYVLVFIAIAAGVLKWLPNLALAWLAVIASAVALAPAAQASYVTPNLATLGLYAINSGFIFGLMAQRFIARIPVLAAGALGVALVVAVEIWPTRFAMLQACAGVGFIVVALVAREQQRGMPQVRALARLGDWSYAMYLVHIPILIAVCKLAPRTMPTGSVLLIAGVAVLAGAAAVGQLDLAMYARLKRAADKAPRSTRVAIATTMLVAFAGSAGLGLQAMPR